MYARYERTRKKKFLKISWDIITACYAKSVWFNAKTNDWRQESIVYANRSIVMGSTKTRWRKVTKVIQNGEGGRKYDGCWDGTNGEILLIERVIEKRKREDVF